MSNTGFVIQVNPGTDLTRLFGAIQDAYPKANANFQNFLEALETLLSHSETLSISQSELMAACTYKRISILNQLKRFEQNGFLTKDMRRISHRTRSVRVYTLHIPEPDQTLATVQDPPSDDWVDYLTHKRPYNPLVKCHNHDRLKTVKGDLFTFFDLAPALSLGATPKTRQDTTIYHRNKNFQVTITSQDDAHHGIPTVHDLKALAAAWSLCRRELKSASAEFVSAEKYSFEIDIDDLLRTLRRPTSTNNRKTVFQQLLRFNQSNFKIADTRYRVLNEYAKSSSQEVYFLDHHFSIISELCVLSTFSNNQKCPEQLAITWPDILYPALLDDRRSLTIHSKVLNTAFRQFDLLIYNWCRRHVRKQTDFVEVDFKQLNLEAVPLYKTRDFNRNLKRLFQDPLHQFNLSDEATYQLKDTTRRLRSNLLRGFPGFILDADFDQKAFRAKVKSEDDVYQKSKLLAKFQELSQSN